MASMLEAKHAIVIGASSGMGREVAKRLSNEGYTLGLAARRTPLLETLQQELHGPSIIKQIDVISPNAQEQLKELIAELGSLDLIVISITSYLDNRNSTSADTKNDYEAFYNPKKRWPVKARTLDVDFKGFIAMADVAFDYFEAQNHGHVVGITSTSGLRGNASTPEYSAAKAGLSCYLEAKRNLMVRDNINVQVTDVIPGFVAVEHSPLGEDPNAYWEITVEEAGIKIVDGILKQKKIVYVPGKVWLLSLLKYIPDCVYQRYFNWM
jgi:short-subunit dehydrogenase